MRTITPLCLRRGWIFFVACLLPMLAHGQAGAGGSSIAGRVSNSATRSYLEGATVAIDGTNRTAITDREGRYQFTDVPAGPVTLAVSFAGLDTQKIPVTAQSGQTVTRDIELTSEIYKLEKFTVAGQREGTAKAETLQRIAPNVKAVVSSDTFGNVADGNIGDLLQHMAGLTGDYNGPEVRQVSIRGVSSALNSVTMDGQQVASAQSAGTGRQFEFEQASLGNIETIEVTKAPTPDMDGASIGGSVNLVTKSAFDRAGGRVITFGAGFATQTGWQGHTDKWKQPVKGYGPSFNFSYQDVLGEKRNIGITVTGLLHSAPQGNANINNSYERKNAEGPAFNYSTGRRMLSNTRTRVAAGVKLDYRWSDETTVSFNTSWNYFHEDSDSRTHTLSTVGVATTATPQVLATVDANGNRTGGGYINPNYTSQITRVYAHPTLSLSNGSVGATDKSGRTYLFSPSVKHRFDGMTINYSLSYSNSATYYDPSQNRSKYVSRPKGTVIYQMGGVGYIVDRTQFQYYPVITQAEGPNLYDLNNYRSLLLTQTDQRGYDTVLGGKFDFKKDLRLSLPTYLKTGFTVQEQRRHLWQDPRRYNYTGPDGVFGTADDNTGLGQFAEAPRGTSDEDKYYKNRGGVPPWMSPFGVARHQKLYPELWKEDIAFTSGKLTSNQMMKEQVAAAYVMGNVKIGAVSALAGVRMEDTQDEGEGPVSRLSPVEVARRAAWVGPITDPEQRRRNLEQFGARTTNKGQYRFYLPGVHLKYEPISGLVSRLSWSTGVGRPAFGSILPNTTVSDTAQTVTISNPSLRPQYSNNWDFTAEYYFKPQGMVSIGAFHKKIRDYIGTDNSQYVVAGQDNGFDGQFVGYNIRTSANNGYATIKGIEASYQQQLTFLPGWAKGLGLYANYTKLQTEGNNSAFTTGAASSAGGTIAGFLDSTGNLGLSYRGHGFDLQLQAVYRGKYLTSNSTTAALVIYQTAKTTWSWKSRYNFSKNLGVFFDVENLFEEPLDNLYALYPERYTTYRVFHAKITGGLTGRF